MSAAKVFQMTLYIKKKKANRNLLCSFKLLNIFNELRTFKTNHFMYKTILLIPFLLMTTFVSAQTNLSEALDIRHKQSLQVLPTPSSIEQYLENAVSNLGLESQEDLAFKKSFKAPNFWERQRYEQQYRGLPVLGSSHILHVKNQEVVKVSGSIYPYIDIETKPKVSEAVAIASLKEQLIQHVYEANGDAIAVFEDLNIVSKRLCVADKAYPDFSGSYHLLYEIVAEYFTPHHHKARYLVDANTSEIVDEFEMICSVSVEGTANTRYYGEQTITTDSIAPNQFVMYDEDRSILTLDANNYTGGQYGYAPFVDEDNYWDNANENFDEVAGDAHYCTAKYHDFMEEHFDWSGVDGEGGDLVSIVHIGGKYFLNAYWDGTATHYGNGQCVDYGPLTTLDVVGHEFAHGFTTFTSGLIYRNESGALNESISDILGKALENAYDQENFTWNIGEKFVTGNGMPFRNMANPKEFESPDFYKGEFWITGLFDNGGVHFNSGVYNYWYYMLVEGKAGVNEAGNAYDVPAIGWEKATDIVYGTQVGYFTPSTNYVDAYNYTLQYVEDVWGAESPEYEAVAEAWYAVGLSNDIDQTNISGAIEIPGDINTLCEGDVLEIPVLVLNTGLDTIFAPGVINMRYTLDNSLEADEQIVLSEDFAPGDTIQFTFEKLIEYDPNDNQKYLQVYMSVNNLDNFEQIAYDFINFTSGEGSDLFLDRVQLTSSVCNPGVYTLVYYFELESCDPIPAGEVLELTFDFDGEEYVVERFVNTPIRPSITYINITSVSFPFPLEKYNDFTVDLYHESDDDLTNNTLSSFLLTYDLMGNNDIEDYEDFSDTSSDYIYFDPGFSHEYQLDELSGDRWLAIGSNNSFFTPSPCPDPEDIFDLYYFYGTDQSLCYNTIDMEEPVLRFEMINYYSGLVEGLEEGFSSMTKIRYDEGLPELSEYPIIHSIPEGEMMEMEFDLPIGNGTLYMTSLCMLGNASDFFAGEYENIDAVLYNNVRIEEKTFVSNDDKISHESIQVYPNPSHGTVYFESTMDAPYDLNIYTIDGKRMLSKQQIQGDFTWQNSADSGLYLYDIKHKDGTIEQGKIVIQ